MFHSASRKADRAAAVRLVGVEYRAAVARDPAVAESAFRRRYPDLADGQEWSNGPWVTPAPTSAGPATGSGSAGTATGSQATPRGYKDYF